MSVTLDELIPLSRKPIPPEGLRDSDEVPLDSPWHRSEINLLVESVDCQRMPRTDHFAGGNTFVYYNDKQWDPEFQDRPEFRGPDFFFVEDVNGAIERRYWVVWEENDRFPDVIVELLSPTTRKIDLTIKKEIYETIFKTREYFCYDPDDEKLIGWRLGNDGKYRPIKPNAKGFLWCKKLGLWLGKWTGVYLGKPAVWLRFYDEEFKVVPTFADKGEQRAEQEKQRAEQEKQRADQLASEVEHLKKLLAEKGQPPSPKKNGKNGKNGKR